MGGLIVVILSVGAFIYLEKLAFFPDSHFLKILILFIINLIIFVGKEFVWDRLEEKEGKCREDR